LRDGCLEFVIETLVLVGVDWGRERARQENEKNGLD
jgi:hypothetical protein